MSTWETENLKMKTSEQFRTTFSWNYLGRNLEQIRFYDLQDKVGFRLQGKQCEEKLPPLSPLLLLKTFLTTNEMKIMFCRE